MPIEEAEKKLFIITGPEAAIVDIAVHAAPFTDAAPPGWANAFEEFEASNFPKLPSWKQALGYRTGDVIVLDKRKKQEKLLVGFALATMRDSLLEGDQPQRQRAADVNEVMSALGYGKKYRHIKYYEPDKDEARVDGEKGGYEPKH